MRSTYSPFYPLGYPVRTIGSGIKKRKPLGEVAHREKWGQPLPA